jgi:hypothetical protein
MAFCFGPRQRPYALSALIPNIWVPRSAFLPCSILGTLTCFFIPTCIVWSPRWSLCGWHRVGFLPSWIFLVRPGPLPAVSSSIPGISDQALDAGKVEFFSALESLRDRSKFLDYWAPTCEAEWVVYAKRPFAGPEQVLDYVGRYTHRVVISNYRILDIAESKVTFRTRIVATMPSRRRDIASRRVYPRFLLHVLPDGFQRIRSQVIHDLNTVNYCT